MTTEKRFFPNSYIYVTHKNVLMTYGYTISPDNYNSRPAAKFINLYMNLVGQFPRFIQSWISNIQFWMKQL